MEFSTFALKRDTLIVLPRFVRPEEYEIVFREYLIKRGFHSQKIQIYKSLYEAVYMPQNKEINIYLVEWGADYSLIERLLGYEDMTLVKVSFAKDYRGAKFRTVEIPLSGDMASWYQNITFSEVSNSIKFMAGNHFFGNSTTQERVKSLSEPRSYASRLQDQEDEILFSQGLEMNPKARTLRHAHIDSLEDLGTDKFEESDRELALDSPKLYEIVKEYVSNPGKYVILTSYTFIYGARFFKYLLSRIFTGSPLVLDAHSSQEKTFKVISEYNNSKYNILITSIVPPHNLVGTTRLIVIDTFDINLLITVLKSICSSGCGNPGTPLPVDLFYLKYFNNGFYADLLSMVTYDQEAAVSTLNQLQKHEEEYAYLRRHASSMIIKDDKFLVTSPSDT